MTPESQQIAIAEALGWKGPFVVLDGPFEDSCPRGTSPTSERRYLPDFLRDLNAMHEAEKVLTGNQREDYAERLKDIQPYAISDNEGYPQWDIVFVIATATAAQRSEAFLRATGRWVES